MRIHTIISGCLSCRAVDVVGYISLGSETQQQLTHLNVAFNSRQMQGGILGPFISIVNFGALKLTNKV